MAKQLNVDMSIRADTSQAKQAMMELQKSLNDILATRTITVNDTSINNAKQAAIDLKHHLEAATNVQTGKLDLSKFSASLNKSGQSLQGLYNNLSQIGPAGQSAFLALSKSIAKADASAITLGGKLNGLMVTLKNTAKWQLSSSLLHGFMGAIQGAYGYAQDLNKSLNNIRVVTGQNIDQMAKFAKEANNAAKTLSTTTTEYTDAALIYYQQGLTDEQVKERTDATIKLANVSRQSAEEVSSQMTAIWNNFDDGSKSLEYYEDVITALGASTASSSQEIAEGLSKFAAVADTVGLSYDKAASAVATVVAETRQSADTVGTAFKTMFARVEGLKLGDTLEDGVDLNKYSKALNTVGVSILDTSGQLKEMDDILDELGEKWASIDKTQQVALAQTVAGVRQYTQFVALMDNYDKVQKNQGIAENSEGTVNKQAEIYAESWEAARDRVTAAAEEIYDQLLNDEAFIDILNGVEKFLGFISNIIDGLGGLKGVLLLIGSILMQQYAKEVPTMMEKMAMNIRILTGEEEKRRQAMLKENADLINNKMQQSESTAVNMQIEGMKKVSAMYSELAEKRKTLSSVELASFENQIKEVEARTALAAAIGKEIDELNREAKVLENQIKGEIGYTALNNNLSATMSSKNFEGDKNAIQQGIAVTTSINGTSEQQQGQKDLEILQQKQVEYQKLQNLKNLSTETNNKLTKEEENQLTLFEKQYGSLSKLNNLIKNTQNDLNKAFTGKDLFKAFKDGNTALGKMQGIINHIGEKTESWKTKLDSIGNDKGKIADLQKEMMAYIKEAEEAGLDTSELKADIDALGSGITAEKIDNLKQSFINLAEVGMAKSADQMEILKVALNNLGVDPAKLEEIQRKIQLGGQAAAEAKAELNQLMNATTQTVNHTMKTSEMFAQLGSTIMQVSMAINALKNIGNIWSNEDLSTGEKILQTMTAFGTLIPTIITLTNKEKIVQMGNTAAKLLGITATKGKIVATGAEVAATEGKIAADEAAAISGWAALGPLLLFVGIAAAVVVAIGLLVYGISQLVNAETEEEKASRLANEQLERSKKAAEEAKQAYQDLKDKISNYDDAIEALEKCTKGTQEWRDAFQEVMDQISEIIAAYPQLLQYDDLFNNDGTFNKQRLEKILKLSQNTAAAASSAQIKNTARVEQTALDEKTAKKIDELKKSNELYDYDKKEHKNVEKAYTNTLDNGLQGEIGASQIMEAVSQAIITNSQDINFNDVNNKDLKDYISNYIEEHYNLASSDLIEATTDISSALVDASTDLRTLGEETNNLATKMHNASNTAFENLFADKKFKNENEEIAYQEAYQEKEKEIKASLDKAQAAGHAGGYSSKGTMRSSHADYANKEYDDAELEKILEIYEKQHPELAGKRSANNYKEWRDGNAFIRYAGQKKEDQKTIEEIAAEVYPILLAQAKEEIEENASKQNYNKDINAQDYFATKGNFDKISYDELKKSFLNNDNKIKNLDDLFGNDEEAKKEYAAKVLGIDKSDITEKNYEEKIQEANQFIEKQTSAAIASLDTIPTFLNKYLSDDLIHKIDLGSLENVGNMYTKILANGGEEGLNILDNIIAKSGNEADEVLSALSNMDLTTMSAKDVNAALADLGLNFQLTETEIYSLGNILQDTSTMTAEAAQETYKTISSILSKLKEEGDIVSQEDYEKLMKLNPALSSYFTMMADGTYMLVGAAQDFKTATQRSLIYQMEQTINNQQRIADAYGTLAKGTGLSADEITSAKIEVLSDNATTKQEAEYYKAAIAAGKELTDVHSQVAASYDKLGLSGEDFAIKAKAAIEQVDKLTAAMKESQFQFELSNAGLDYETTENYAEVLMDVHEAEGLSKDAARELAIANQRLDRGLTSLNDNFEQWSSNLKNNSKETAEYAQTIGDLRKAFADLLNIADGNELSLKWIEKWANDADEMAKILDGDTEAIQRFRESAFVEMTNNVFDQVKESAQEMLKKIEDIDNEAYNSLEKLINQLETSTISASGLREAIKNIGNSEIGSGAVLSEEYTKALNTMLQQGLLTEQQLNDIFASIGYKPKVTTELVDQMTEIPVYETVETVYEDTKPQPMYVGVDDGKTRRQEYIGTKPGTYRKQSYTKQVGSKFMSQRVPVVQIEDSKTASGNIEIVNAGTKHINPSYGSTTSGKDSGSGSSSSPSTPTTKAASHNHEVNRYSDEENALEGLSKQYERLGKAKDKAFGKNKINLIEQEIQALKQLKNASSDYLNAVAGDADRVVKAIQNGENIGNLIANGALGGTLTSDYNSLYGGGKQVEYTAKDEAGNEWLESRYYSLDDFNSVFGSNLQFNLDSFGNIQGRDSILNFLQDLKNNEADAYAAVANPTAESTNEYNLRNALIETVIDHIKQYEDSVDKFTEQTDDYLDRITELQDKNAELITAKMDLGVNLSQKTTQRLERALLVLGEDYYKDSDSMKKYFEINQRKMEKDATLAEQYATTFEEVKRGLELYEQNPNDPNAITPEAAAQMFSDLEDGMDDLIKEGIDSIESTKDLFSTTLNYWGEKISSIMDQIKENQNVLNHYLRVAELTGKGEDYAYMEKLQQGHFSNAKKAYQEAARQTHMADEMLENAKKEYEAYAADKNHSQEEKDAYYEEHVASAQKYRDERYQTQVELGEMMMESDNTKFEYSAKKYLQEFENAATGPWGSFDTWNQSMERQKSITDEVLTKTNQLYETNTLLRKLSQDMDKTDSQNAKLKLKNFANEIDYMKNQEQLTKTDLEIAKARYEVLKAEIDLENTRNSKSTVRLKRDSEGNYGYIYTADQDAINDAEQNLEDKHNALYNLLLNYTNEYAQKLIEIDQQFSTALLELYTKNFESEEERQIAVTELMRQWNDTRALALQQYNGFIVQLDEVAATDRAEAWTTSYAQTIMDQQTWKTHAEDMNRKVSKSHANLERDWVNYRTREIGADEDVAQSLRKVLDRTEELKMSLNGQNGLISRMADTTRTAQQLSNAFYNQHDAIRKTISGYRDLADEMSNNYFRTVDLINTQIALNYAQRGATSVSWGSEGVYANFDDGGSVQNNAGSTSSSTPSGGNNGCPPHDYQFDRMEYDTTTRDKTELGSVYPGGPTGTRIVQETLYRAKKIYRCSKCGKEYTVTDRDGYKTYKVSGFGNRSMDGIEAANNRYKTGGYTGSWNGPDIEENGKLAFLHQKELVLNADDTENILDAVKLIRQISQSIDLQVAARGASISSLGFSLSNPDNILQQDVTIHAEFPNVSDHNEIEEALANLVNRASQFAYRN